MEIRRFDWDESNCDHVARHGVDPDEVEEVFVQKRFTQRSRRGTYVTYGRTFGGRLLFVAWVKKPGGILRPITARPMVAAERKRFEREVRP
jgi:uncharacterized DUF497 family protein